MHKVDATGATGANEFTDGDPAIPTAATVLGQKWHNAVQREIVEVVENVALGGITLDDTDDTQLGQAIAKLLSSRDKFVVARDSATQISLTAGSNYDNYITINFERMDISSPWTLTTSDNLLAADGTDSAGGPSSSTFYYIYASNSSASYRDSDIGLSATAPNANGYLAASGNGNHWRHIGNVYLDGSTQIAAAMNLVGLNSIDSITETLSGTITRNTGGAAWYEILTFDNVAVAKSLLVLSCFTMQSYNVTRATHARVREDASSDAIARLSSPTTSAGNRTVAAQTLIQKTTHDEFTYELEYEFDGGGDTLSVSNNSTQLNILRITP